MTMDPSHWHYMAEGGEHAIFSYRTDPPEESTDTPSSDGTGPGTGTGAGTVQQTSNPDFEYHGKILRIRKQDMITILSLNLNLDLNPSSRATISNSSSVPAFFLPSKEQHEYVVERQNQHRGQRIELSHNRNKKRNLHMNIIKTVFKDYFDISEILHLNRQFVRELHDQALKSGKISPSRVKDWSISSPHPTTTAFSYSTAVPHHECPPYKQTTTTIEATLHPNYAHSSPMMTPLTLINSTLPAKNFITTTTKTTTKTSTISIEIKPKAGYLASSPLVHPLHRAKYYHTRFQLNQQLHHEGIITKGWKKHRLEKKSNYDPSDFLSGKSKRIKKALRELFANPQNNLKVTYQNQTLYGMTKDGNASEDDGDVYRKAMEDLFHINYDEMTHDDHNNDSNNNLYIESSQLTKLKLASELQDITALILEKDEFLTTLGVHQESLDNLDADGAVLVYKRLVELCGGSQHRAEFLVDYSSNSSSLYYYFSNYYHYHYLIKSHKEEEEVNAELKRWDAFLWGHQFNQSEGDDVWDRNYERGAKLVKEFSQMTCVYLLQQWLTSLALCDLSFFLNISALPPSAGASAATDSYMGSDSTIEWRGHYGWRPNRGNDKKNALGSVINKNGKIWYYKIKVVDCDGKPAHKLRKREQKERMMRFAKKT